MAKKGEVKVCGRSACRALFGARPGDVIRVYLEKRVKKDFSQLLAYCAKQRLAYHLVDADELTKVAATEHHEGICILARAFEPTFDELLEKIGRGPACVLALDGVKNPHNLGAILRTAAHFGVLAVLRTKGDGRTPPSAHRVAEGGAEVVPVIRVDDLKPAIERLSSIGFEVIATAADGRTDVFTHRFTKRTVIVLGAEREGVSKRVRRLADTTVSISGTGDVESLNVSASAAVLLAQRWRATGRRV